MRQKYPSGKPEGYFFAAPLQVATLGAPSVCAAGWRLPPLAWRLSGDAAELAGKVAGVVETARQRDLMEMPVGGTDQFAGDGHPPGDDGLGDGLPGLLLEPREEGRATQAAERQEIGDGDAGVAMVLDIRHRPGDVLIPGQRLVQHGFGSLTAAIVADERHQGLGDRHAGGDRSGAVPLLLFDPRLLHQAPDPIARSGGADQTTTAGQAPTELGEERLAAIPRRPIEQIPLVEECHQAHEPLFRPTMGIVQDPGGKEEEIAR